MYGSIRFYVVFRINEVRLIGLNKISAKESDTPGGKKESINLLSIYLRFRMFCIDH
jgi:hypothetical protein